MKSQKQRKKTKNKMPKTKNLEKKAFVQAY